MDAVIVATTTTTAAAAAAANNRNSNNNNWEERSPEQNVRQLVCQCEQSDAKAEVGGKVNVEGEGRRREWTCACRGGMILGGRGDGDGGDDDGDKYVTVVTPCMHCTLNHL